MKKFILDLIVKENVRVNKQYVLLILTADEALPPMLPGQFVEVKVENSPNTFLRRPISINYVDYKKNELWLLVQIVGDGTLKMSELKENDSVNLILPLGNTFTLPEKKDSKILLVGGGVGTAPLLYLGAYLKENGYPCSFLLGGRSKDNLLQLCDFESIGEVLATTEDGSFGEKGFVTQHSVLNKIKFDAIYTCGPTPMMKAVAEYAKRTNTFCEVSLENTMACGIGACLCCVTDTTEGHVCVCTEGPVFNIEKLKW
ncbi:dihydroorotate dehydrogenase electron transfer subunit [Paludibacter sp. 221]|uniref:dihydroorotate dehydrogenase electron transfer subunit n=1 Tax=Paludibacter sp. 221 TaxID=2302939 RepID=UPI0013D3D429|nr:dihydroorotate dehydrogenase electron transfer subunit [Paludibacter sp. 221]NDV47246.1 dihydroorotate dehydrogenase electron transfer subunit [Paludibacter sp. 221]